MDPDEFTIVVESSKGAREALVDLWKAALAAGWVVVGDYDLTGLLAGGGAGGVSEIKSLDICHPELARPFVKAELRTALCMPCNVLVCSEGGRTRLMAMRPGVMMPKLFPKAIGALGDLPERVDRELERILRQAA
jgi:uncharacterized protein (DUF302 family)